MTSPEPELIAQILPDGAEQRFPSDQPVTIGRDPAAQVVVDQGAVSRRHAVAVVEPGTGWVLMDRSTNGTFLGDQRVGRIVISGPLTVRIGDPRTGVEVRLAPAAGLRDGVARGGQDGSVGQARFEAGSPPKLGQLGALKASHLGLGVYSRAIELPTVRIRIGRAPDNDVVVPDLLVSRHHAEVRTSPDGRYQVADLGSHNGTYLNGKRLQGRATVSDGTVIAIGHHTFVLSGGRLEEFVDAGSASFAALDLSVKVGAKYLLKGLSFAADGGDFVTVLGPTGAGKSTLIKALSGYRPADSGSVLYNGRDIYASYQELRNRIGYVPQDDVLHPQLTVRSALRYSARLRFPPDVPAGQRNARVEEVIGELGLGSCADLRLATVSGGQRKRTSIALELLTKPSLLILDEPTSGLDPWYEWTVMELMRTLADGGRTVIAVTHTVESLDLCNRILFLAPGGQTAYFGPPAESLAYFGAQRYKEIFNQLNHAPSGQLAEKFVSSAEDAKYVEAPLAAVRAGTPSAGTSTPAASAASPGWTSQLATLVRRFTAVVAADRRNMALLFLQAPVLGLLMAAILPTDSLAAIRPGQSPHAVLAHSRGAPQIITALVLGATYLGASNSIREIVKERAILTRERAVGLSPPAYVLSKVFLLGLLTVAQAAVLVALGLLRQHGPAGAGAVLPNGEFELFLVASAAGLAAMSLGLLISAFVSNADKALTILPVVLFAQFLLTGGLFSVNAPGIQQLSYLSSAHWGYAAAASTVDLDRLTFDGCNHAPSGGEHVACDGTRAHTVGAWSEDMAVLLLLSAAFLAGAAVAVQRIGQPRRVTSRVPAAGQSARV